MIDSEILTVNNRSSAIGGSGNTIIASISSMTAGVPNPVKKPPRAIGSREAGVATVLVAIRCYLLVILGELIRKLSRFGPGHVVSRSSPADMEDISEYFRDR